MTRDDQRALEGQLQRIPIKDFVSALVALTPYNLEALQYHEETNRLLSGFTVTGT